MNISIIQRAPLSEHKCALNRATLVKISHWVNSYDESSIPADKGSHPHVTYPSRSLPKIDWLFLLDVQDRGISAPSLTEATTAYTDVHFPPSSMRCLLYSSKTLPKCKEFDVTLGIFKKKKCLKQVHKFCISQGFRGCNSLWLLWKLQPIISYHQSMSAKWLHFIIIF